MSASVCDADSARVYLKYAADLESTEPIVALCCRTFFIQKVIETKQQRGVEFTPTEGKFIAQMLDFVESSKQKLGLGNETRKDKLEDFCSRVFIAVEREEKSAEEITKIHAMQFHSTAQLIDLMSLFGRLSPVWSNRRILVQSINTCIGSFCKLKAALILRCINNHKSPPRGRPCDSPKAFEAAMSLPAPAEEEKGKLQPSPAESQFTKSSSCDAPPPTVPQPVTPFLDSVIIPSVNRASFGSPPVRAAPWASMLDQPETGPVIIPMVSHNMRPLQQQSMIVSMPKREPMPTAAGTKIAKADPRYAMVLAQTQKLAEYALSELEFKKVKSAKQLVEQAIQQLSLLAE